MSLYGIQGVPAKADRQVINKECSEDVSGDTKEQLVYLQSKTCHSQDTSSWEYGPNSASDSAIPKLCYHEQGIQRTTTPLSPQISERIAHSLANRLETVRVSHWPITWLIYLPCTVAQGQSHCASNIISNSHLLHSKWVDPPIPKLQQLQYLTLKIQGQGHGWGQSLKSQCESNILSTHIPFIPCQSAIPFLRYAFFKIWPWKSKVKVMEEVNIESHNMGPTFCRLKSLSFHVNRPSHSWDTDFFKIWPWKSKVKVMGEGNVESHKVGVTSYRFTSLSFHVNRPFHSWDTAFSKFDLENPRSRSNDHGVAQLQVKTIP